MTHTLDTPDTPMTSIDYLAEWLQDASALTSTSPTDHDTYNVMYQIAEGVYKEVFQKASLRVRQKLHQMGRLLGYRERNVNDNSRGCFRDP